MATRRRNGRCRFFAGRKRHSLFYQYQFFVDNLGTSQVAGGFGYLYSHSDLALRIFIENDAFAFLFRDEFRTSAAEISVHSGSRTNTFGIGVGTVLWTGQGRGFLGREYSHGILYLTLFHNFCKLSLGWDAEAIRFVQQNAIHTILGIGTLPQLDRPDRVYLQLECNPLYTLY